MSNRQKQLKILNRNDELLSKFQYENNNPKKIEGYKKYCEDTGLFALNDIRVLGLFKEAGLVLVNNYIFEDRMELEHYYQSFRIDFKKYHYSITFTQTNQSKVNDIWITISDEIAAGKKDLNNLQSSGILLHNSLGEFIDLELVKLMMDSCIRKCNGCSNLETTFESKLLKFDYACKAGITLNDAPSNLKDKPDCKHFNSIK